MNKEELVNEFMKWAFTKKATKDEWRDVFKNKLIELLDQYQPESDKPVLPQKVADELEDAKHQCFNIRGYLEQATSNGMFHATRNYCTFNDDHMNDVCRAWLDGYTVEKPKLYNLILNDDFNDKIICLLKQPILDEIWTAYETNDINLKHNEKYQFNQEEIDKYNEDFRLKNIDLNDYKVEVEE